MTLNRRIVILMTLIAVTLCAAAQDLRRTSPGRRAGRRVVREVVIESDTVALPHVDSVLVTAYEKPLRAMREAFTIVNNTSRPIEAAMIGITYRNLSGTMLHRASHTVATYIPPGESRRVSVPAFDTTGTYYYKESAEPRRAAKAVPYDVDIVIEAVVHPSLKQP